MVFFKQELTESTDNMLEQRTIRKGFSQAKICCPDGLRDIWTRPPRDQWARRLQPRC
ncbi:hypothetical protein DESC_720281 [Desulfosarcina cetonica]|nr:hypothetical protein DESC_720281 [Desulfosarcina cetonica]